MPSTMHSFQDDMLKAIDGLPMPSAGPVPPGLSIQEAIEAGLVPALDRDNTERFVYGNHRE